MNGQANHLVYSFGAENLRPYSFSGSWGIERGSSARDKREETRAAVDSIDDHGRLIYMSILDEIQRHCREGRLSEHIPVLPGAYPPRRIFLSTDDVLPFLMGRSTDSIERRRRTGLIADLDMIVTGKWVRVPKTAGTKKNKTAQIAQLDPIKDDVWEIRNQIPSPGIRIFGSFAVKDVFVGLTFCDRDALMDRKTFEGRQAWRECVVRSKTAWRNLFVATPPFSGEYPYDYLSRVYLL